jgi:predicted ATP-dependent Lon-type protease
MWGGLKREHSGTSEDVQDTMSTGIDGAWPHTTDAGDTRLMLPMPSVKGIPTISWELFAKSQTGLYGNPVDAVFKAMGCD